MTTFIEEEYNPLEVKPSAWEIEMEKRKIEEEQKRKLNNIKRIINDLSYYKELMAAFQGSIEDEDMGSVSYYFIDDRNGFPHFIVFAPKIDYIKYIDIFADEEGTITY